VTAVLEALDLDVHRGTRAVLHGVALRLDPGEALALVGPNAAGKSTLVRTLAGILRPDRGEILLEGRTLAGWPRDAVARRIALVAPDVEAAGVFTVAERVRLGRYPHRGPFRPMDAADHAAVGTALRRAGIEHLAERRLSSLSAGERQLATVARGLAQEPRVLILDEPAAHLDVGHQLRLFRVLDDVRAGGVAVLAVVHDLQRAAAWASRMALLADGRIAAEGRPADVLASTAASAAFEVAIRGHAVPGLSEPLYTFEERPAGDVRT
jgi:iron complex transport system ATP-binding protein